ncbi:hypothetical protein A4A49_56715 [Nicotiana attenuata]|uniref:Uncharacterized protein n=1 Tax=Nicotiana attenuata TaxID=49451 RepID=A0A1J6IAV4_NICAT|nr:hypothetical protein A4A49_56715 [Nicotiana attenuata]
MHAAQIEKGGSVYREFSLLEIIEMECIKGRAFFSFYHNRVVGQHHASFTRHLGILVHDRNMCPLRVHSWTDIEEYKLQLMWEAVTDKFDSDNINDQRDHVLKHMRKLWNNWRGSMHKNIKSKELKGGNSSKAALLEKLNATVKENESLKGRLEGLESKYDELQSKYVQLAKIVFEQPSSPSSSDQQIESFNRLVY